MVWRCPGVRFLDFKKVKDVERAKAKEMFGTTAEPSALASKVCLSLRMCKAYMKLTVIDHGCQISDIRSSFNQ